LTAVHRTPTSATFRVAPIVWIFYSCGTSGGSELDIRPARSAVLPLCINDKGGGVALIGAMGEKKMERRGFPPTVGFENFRFFGGGGRLHVMAV
jgi:hypothetical protein